MTTQPLVSVIVPVYNAADYLPATFRSFEGQSYGNTEWILVDDGSSDDSADLCNEWCSIESARRSLIRKQNGGASSARNVGLEHAAGDYVLFWDCDDEQSPTAIERLVENSPGCDGVAVCAIRRVLPDGNSFDLFACRRHESTSEDALDEWLRGGCLQGRIPNWFQGGCSSTMGSGLRRVLPTRTFCGRRRFLLPQLRLFSLVMRFITTLLENPA